MSEKEQGSVVQLPQTWAADWILEKRLGSGAYSTVYHTVRRDHPGIDAAIKIISIPSSQAEADTLRAEGYTDEQSQSYYDDVARQYISEIELMYTSPGERVLRGAPPLRQIKGNGRNHSGRESNRSSG